MSIEAMKQALEALEDYEPNSAHKAAKALRLAIEQAERQDALDRMADHARELGLDYTPMQAEKQEPVAWMNDSTPAGVFARHKQGAENFGCTIPLYTAPPQRQPLTEEEIKTVRHLIDWTAGWSYIDFARAIERKHGITGENK